jgi:hypothetical protein
MRSAVAVQHADAHLRHHLGQAQFKRVQQVLFAFFRIQAARRLKRQPRTHCAGPHTQQYSQMMNLAAIAGLGGKPHLGAHTGPGQGHMYRARAMAIGIGIASGDASRSERISRDAPVATKSMARRARISTAISSVVSGE